VRRTTPDLSPLAGLSQLAGRGQQTTELPQLATHIRDKVSASDKNLGQESTWHDNRAVCVERELAELRNVLGEEKTERTANLSLVESRIAERLDAMQAQYGNIQATLGALVNGVETWLLPTLAEHDAALKRIRRPGWMPARLRRRR
jgi:hypothetical protein